jgi:hypothetical protein
VLWLIIGGVVLGILLLAWTTRLTANRPSPGIRWHGIDWKRQDDDHAERDDEPKS